MSESNPYLYSTYGLLSLVVATLLRRLYQSKCLLKKNGDIEMTIDTMPPSPKRNPSFSSIKNFFIKNETYFTEKEEKAGELSIATV